MEYPLDLNKKSRDQQSSRTLENTIQPQASQSLKLQEKLKTENSGLSYADFHNVVTNNVKGVPPKSSRNPQKQQISRKATREEELVKYMSSLPSYLERGEKPQEKVLNIGVLDWGLLEKWKDSQKQTPCRSSRCSPSSSNASPYFSTDGSSIHSSRERSSSPSHRRTGLPSLQHHLMAPPTEGHSSSSATSSQGDVGKFRDLKAPRSNIVNGKSNFTGTDHPFTKNEEIKPDQHRNKVPKPNIDRDTRSLPKKVSYEVVSSPKGKMKTREGEFGGRTEDLQEPKANNVSQDVPEKKKTVVLLLPRDIQPNNQSVVCQASGQRLAAESRIRFSERSKQAYCSELKSDIPHSFHLPCKVNSNELSQREQPGFIDADDIKLPSARSQSVSGSAMIGISPSKGKNIQERNSTITHPNSARKEPSKGFDIKASRAGAGNASKEIDLKASKTAAEKPRSISPFRRFSIGMGNTSKDSADKEGLNMPQLRSTSVPVKPVSENYTSLDCSSNGKSNSSGRNKTSPLRRLLNPLMKPKGANNRQLPETSQKYSISTDRACKLSSNGLSDSSDAQLGKGKLDMNGCKGTNVIDSCQGKKHGSSNLQALLRFSIKNGLPLFTFAVDNDSDIFAATMKLSTSRKDDHSCIYTFFTIREVKKKKGGWLSQGGKGKGHDYIPGAVAQMKVFDSHLSNLTKQNFANHSREKEFVLFSVELGEGDQGTSNFQPTDELAAIVVKMPKRMHQNSVGDGYQSNNFSGARSEEHFPNVRRYSYSGDDESKQPLVSNQEGIRTTVIFPSGTHSLPSKGEPSSLVQRWKTGGSCDCGGWDLGCKLKILVNSSQKLAKKSSSSSIRDQFVLFTQDGVEENCPALSLAPFEDGIFSVEFNSSLTLLQAFSTCIAILDGRNLCDLSQSKDLFEEKDSEETIFARNDVAKNGNQAEGEVPARYVSYPPLSPVGRV